MKSGLKENKTILLTTIIGAVAFIAFCFGSQYPQIDYAKKIAGLVSCAPYEESFLQSVGFKNRNDCVDFNIELEDVYKNDCQEVIEKTDNQKFNDVSLDACIYHSFSGARTSFDSKYYVFKHAK
jgi:hypothetical protein